MIRRYLMLSRTGGVKIRPRRTVAAPVEPHWGPAKWIALHRFALAWDGDLIAADAHLAQLAASLPECCKPHWIALVAEHPPDFASAETFFAWTVARHNEVSRRIGRPELPLGEARALYE